MLPAELPDLRVSVPSRDEVADSFATVEAELAGERPQAVLVRQVADGMRQARADGKRLLWVVGPGVVRVDF